MCNNCKLIVTFEIDLGFEEIWKFQAFSISQSQLQLSQVDYGHYEDGAVYKNTTRNEISLAELAENLNIVSFITLYRIRYIWYVYSLYIVNCGMLSNVSVFTVVFAHTESKKNCNMSVSNSGWMVQYNKFKSYKLLLICDIQI